MSTQVRNILKCFTGTDTVSTFLEWFILYMVAFPEVQEKFHEDIR